MLGRIVEIADDNRHLSVLRGFLLVAPRERDRQELGRVPLDDIAAVIANAHGITCTQNLLLSLAERGVPFVLCGANHNAAGMLLSIDGHHLQAKRFDAQIASSLPTRKRLWAEIIRAKIRHQAAVLLAVGSPHIPLQALVGRVRSGDTGNVEAQAARRYWGLLFGPDFRRDQQLDGVNALLNYGYTVLRAATARAIVAAGLHPTLGLHHANEGNAMRLADDLMEPFRPLVDLQVRRLSDAGHAMVSAEVKRALVSLLYQDVKTTAGMSPVLQCINRVATSLAQVFLGESRELDLPLLVPCPSAGTHLAEESA